MTFHPLCSGGFPRALCMLLKALIPCSDACCAVVPSCLCGAASDACRALLECLNGHRVVAFEE